MEKWLVVLVFTIGLVFIFLGYFLDNFFSYFLYACAVFLIAYLFYHFRMRNKTH